MDNEVDINDYNSVLLTAYLLWEGNMDIQFIGEKSSLKCERSEGVNGCMPSTR